MKKLVLAALILVSAVAHAAFFDSGQGARPTGIGEAFVAVADDANAMYYNPAGMIQIKMISTTATYTGYMEGLSDSFAAIVVPVPGYGAIGISWLGLTAASSYSESTLKVAYAYPITKQYTVGLALKLLSKSYTLDSVASGNPFFSATSASGLGIDASFFGKLTDEIALGASIENINVPDINVGSSDPVPMNIRVGGRYKLDRSLLVALEGDLSGEDAKIKGGSEYWLDSGLLKELGVGNSELGFRGGVGYGNNSYLNVDLGFSFYLPSKIVDLRFDYSFTMPLMYIEGAGTHRFSICITEPRPAFNL